MPSTFSPLLRTEMVATGEQAGTWSITNNTNIGTLLEQAIAGMANVAMLDADYTLTQLNGATDESRNMILSVTGALTAARNVICPALSKIYVVRNSTTGGFAITVKTAAGTGVSVPSGAVRLVACDGVNVVAATFSASEITNTPSGGITSTDQQAVNNELDTKKAPKASPTFSGPVSTTGTQFNFPANNTSSIWGSTNGGMVQIKSDGATTNRWARLGISDSAGNWLHGLTVFDGGEVAVNTTTGLSSSGKLQTLSTASNIAALSADASHASFASHVQWLNTTRASSSAFNFVYCTSGGYSVAEHQMLGDGSTRNRLNSYGAISDIKLKENITDATPKLANLMKVRIVNYNLIGHTEKQIGVIAQELEKIFPGMVDETADGELVKKTRVVNVPAVDAVLDADGKEISPAVPAHTVNEDYTEWTPTGTTTKSVKYSVFVPMIIKAMQEQQAIIDNQASAIAALEARLTAAGL